jgi:hypothetical protein
MAGLVLDIRTKIKSAIEGEASLSEIERIKIYNSTEEALINIKSANYDDFAVGFGDMSIFMNNDRPAGFNKYEVTLEIILFINKIALTSDYSTLQTLTKFIEHNYYPIGGVDQCTSSWVEDISNFENQSDTGSYTKRYCIIEYRYDTFLAR